MRAAVIIAGIIVALSLLFVVFNSVMINDNSNLNPANSFAGGASNNVSTTTMNITSSAFEHNQTIPEKFTCDGENINPALAFSDIPKETKSLVLIADDPDAPVGLWVHWTVWNIAPDKTTIAENSVPEGGVEGATNFGAPGYGGPCPPDGEHRYFFKLYALDIELNLPKDADKNILEEAMIGHVLDKAELIGLYTRACYETPPCP